METQIDSKETIELPKNISLRNNKYQVRLQFNNSSTSSNLLLVLIQVISNLSHQSYKPDALIRSNCCLTTSK